MILMRNSKIYITFVHSFTRGENGILPWIPGNKQVGTYSRRVEKKYSCHFLPGDRTLQKDPRPCPPHLRKRGATMQDGDHKESNSN